MLCLHWTQTENNKPTYINSDFSPPKLSSIGWAEVLLVPANEVKYSGAFELNKRKPRTVNSKRKLSVFLFCLLTVHA